MAAENPQIVAQIQAKIAEMLKTLSGAGAEGLGRAAGAQSESDHADGRLSISDADAEVVGGDRYLVASIRTEPWRGRSRDDPPACSVYSPGTSSQASLPVLKIER